MFKCWVWALVIHILFPPDLFPSKGQDVDPKEVIRQSQDKLQGESSYASLRMTIIRPSWQREMRLKSWNLGQEYSLILVTAPARDEGVAFLKRDKEIWNWQPSIDRVIKLPPSMMSQSWMGSDFTNDDLVEHSSLVEDFTHEMMGSETVRERECYKIKLIAKEGAAVVWGEIIMWIDKKDYMQLKAEFYDEESYLINTMNGKDPRTWDGKLLPSVLEVEPADEPGNMTRVEYLELEFTVDLNERFFTVQNLQRVR